ncbi:MAG: hypothetical protein A2511_08755 [Deltaproteobacteria bacterium RIFOXYD12_FULL_50_9]|jgi:purine-binding chemotaxis protein CheW|nr:MAG: hypothetical protein A2511_08755 [Deltaproteobacteria bacterium RIFOXYD12_FULL_50_9]
MRNKIAPTVTQPDELQQFSTFYLAEALCGIDIGLIHEITKDFRITKVPLAPDHVVGIMNLRGQIVTVINQSRKIGFTPTPLDGTSSIIIVASKGGEQVGLLVDQIKDVIAVPKRQIAPSPSNVKGAQGKFFAGVVRIEDQELMAVLNVDAVLAP